jgi:hypothetical protein
MDGISDFSLDGVVLGRTTTDNINEANNKIK